MATLSALADNFATNERPAGNLLDGPSVLAQALAAIRGRDYVLPDDVTDVFADVCAHRIVLSPKARSSETSPSDVLAEVLRQVTRPDHI